MKIAREIQIDTIYGKKSVMPEATYGAFAVHQGGFDGCYTVTHIATGLAVTFNAWSVQSGLRLARMQMRAGVRWSFSDLRRMPKTTGVIGRAVVERWRAEQETRNGARDARTTPAVDPVRRSRPRTPPSAPRTRRCALHRGGGGI